MGTVTTRRATSRDAEAIHAVLTSNQDDLSLFQQPLWRVRRNINDFLLAEVDGVLVGCAALHWHRADNAEILAVSVAPGQQGRGVGRALIAECLAWAGSPRTLWLSTRKPDYFGRYGFRPVTKWSLPFGVLLAKVPLVFDQPVARWLPSMRRSQFMRFDGARRDRPGGA